MSEGLMTSEMRNLLVAIIFIGLILLFITAVVIGRRVIATEKTDAVFGNPVRALGGWWWVITGVCSILLMWFYFSWDAARAFFPNTANEMCQVAKVDMQLNPVRSTFPMQSRLLRGTSFLDRDRTQIQQVRERLAAAELDANAAAELSSLADEVEQMLVSLAADDSLSGENAQRIDEIGQRVDALTAQLADPAFPGEPSAEQIEAGNSQPGWGDSKKEIPDIPNTQRGRKFDLVSQELQVVAKDFSAIRNISEDFKTRVSALNERIDVYRKGSEPVAADLGKQLNKILKRVDDGVVFPAGALDPVENALKRFNLEQENQRGNLKWIDRLAMPGGEIVAGNTACTEQGSGRWLPKPSDTLATLVRLSDPDVGFKSNPLLWYKFKPVGEMAAFFIPDWLPDLVPGEYPRHQSDGSIGENLKSKMLKVATGEYPSLMLPIPTGHLWDSIMRVLAGLFLGILLGVPLGLFMGLSRFAKGFFDPLIELYRPVPPLAWAPLILTIFGIQDDGKIFLLFMVAFAIMVISARTGATGTQLSKIHAAHSLGASRGQILRRVILPNSLPEILTGIRISIGVCWGTLVAAEMLAGTTGIGFVENVARKQSDYEVIWVTIILLGLLGLLFDLIMRWIINRTIPWRGKG